MHLSNRLVNGMKNFISDQYNSYFSLVILSTLFPVPVTASLYNTPSTFGVIENVVEVYEVPVFYKLVDEKIGFSIEERKVLLSWTISGNSDVLYFEIERAVDKNLDFKKIGTYTPQNIGSEEVQFQFEDDRLPLTGGKIYYRIKQIEMNGDRNYGRTLSVEVAPVNGTDMEVWRVYPNPSRNGYFQIGMLDKERYAGETLLVRVIRAGDILLSKNCLDINEVNDFLGQNFNDFSSGLILIELRWGFQSQLLKIWNLN